jgi:hypothetical protein
MTWILPTNPQKPEVTMTESILDATEQQLRLARAKITYLGEQTKPVPTVVFRTEGSKPSMEHFLQFQRNRQQYSNDEMPYTKTFLLSPAEFRRALQAVKPVVTDPAAAMGPDFLSFVVVSEADTGLSGQEFLIAPRAGKAFYQKLIGALDPENKTARDTLTSQFRNVIPGEE